MATGDMTSCEKTELFTDEALADFIQRINNVDPGEIVTVQVEIEDDRANIYP